MIKQLDKVFTGEKHIPLHKKNIFTAYENLNPEAGRTQYQRESASLLYIQDNENIAAWNASLSSFLQ